MLRSAVSSIAAATRRSVFSANPAVSQQARSFSQTRVLQWQAADVDRRKPIRVAPWQIHHIQEHQCETRFRLVGPLWGQTLIHKTPGMRKRNSVHTKEWRRLGRWRRLNKKWTQQYQNYLMPAGVRGEHWFRAKGVHRLQAGLT